MDVRLFDQWGFGGEAPKAIFLRREAARFFLGKRMQGPSPPDDPQKRKDTASQRSRSTGPALEAMYQFLLWLVPTLEKFPRSQKFLLGDRLQSQALTVLDCLITATYSRERSAHLRTANLELEKLRFGIRLAKDLRHLDFNRYEYAARAMDDIGRMVGGWLKTQTNATPNSTSPSGGPNGTPA